MAKPQKRPRSLSPMAKHPTYVKAIGMVIIDYGVLEMALGDYLGSLLHIAPKNGQILYLSPQVGYARLAILENLATDGLGIFPKPGEDHRRLLKLLGRARTILGKRHRIVHDSWGVASNKDDARIARKQMPFLEKRNFEFVPLESLRRLLTEIRNLTQELRDEAANNYDSWPPYTLQPKPKPQSRRGRNGTPDTPQTGTAPKLKPRPQS